MTHNSSKKCIVKTCESKLASEWRKITDDVLKKAEINGTLASYYKDYKGEYICRNCYNAILVNARSTFKEHATEWQRELKRNIDDHRLPISESISLLPYSLILFIKEMWLKEIRLLLNFLN